MRRIIASLLALLPIQAMAAVAIVNTPSTINDAANYTAESGSNRVVAICVRGEVASGTTTLSVSDISFGAKTLGGGEIILGASKNNTADWTREFVGIYYVKETNIPAGANAITVTWNQAVVGGTNEITAYTLSGVNQTTPVDTTTTARFPASGSTGTTDHFIASDPTVANNTVQLHCAMWNSTQAATVKGTGWSEDFDANNSGGRAYADSKTTVTGATLDFWGATIASAIQGLGAVVSFAPSVTPTFTSAPAIGTRTTSALPINFTCDTTGTVYGVRCPDGQTAPTAAQVAAGNCTGNVAATQSWSEAVVATVADSHSFSSIIDGTVTDGSFICDDGGGNRSAVSAIADMYKLPAFTSGPTFSSCGTGGCTYSVTLDGPGTVYGVGVKAGQTAPTTTQVEAGQATGGAAAEASANKSVSGADTLTIGSSLPLPEYDFYLVGTYGSQHEASAHVDTSRLLTAPSTCGTGGATACQYIRVASIGAGSPCASFNVATNPDIAANDVLKASATTHPGAFTLTIGTDCQFSYSGDGSRQDAINIGVYDYSAQAFHADDIDFWANNLPPIPPSPTDTITYYIPLNSAMTPIDLSNLCTDPEGDAITVTAVDSLPTGISIVTNVMQGTSTVKGKVSGIRLKCQDAIGDSVTW